LPLLPGAGDTRPGALRGATRPAQVANTDPANDLLLSAASVALALGELARGFGTPLDPRARVEDIGVGQQQRVEILKLLYRGADILILDEPTAVLVPQEVEELFDHMRQLKADGHTIIFIAHSLDEVLEVADRITVLRDGKVIGTVAAADTDTHQVAEMMVGRPVLLRRVEGKATPGEPMLQVKDLRVTVGGKELVAGLDLDVRRSEIYGLAGVEGNGQAELVEALVGLTTPDTGRIYLDDDELTRADVRTRRQAGLAYIPEDRHARGMVLQMLVSENSVLGQQEREPFSRRGLLDLRAIRRRAVELVRSFRVKAPSVAAPAYVGDDLAHRQAIFLPHLRDEILGLLGDAGFFMDQGFNSFRGDGLPAVAEKFVAFLVHLRSFHNFSERFAQRLQ
jgi:simple sugar transport system ATP-binding protein